MYKNDVNSQKNFVYALSPSSFDDIHNLGKALASYDRLKILHALTQPKYMSELSDELGIPLTTVSRHIDLLAKARLINISYGPGLKGHSKLCSKTMCKAEIVLESATPPEPSPFFYKTEMPIGLYSECEVTAPCGMNSAAGGIGDFDDPSVFYTKERVEAELIWFNTGFLTYLIPVKMPVEQPAEELEVSFEACSETIYFRNTWPSDITLSINGKELYTFTSPGDFGGRRGMYTPEFWPLNSTQYGILMKFTVKNDGVYVNDVLKNKKTVLADLLDGKPYIKLTLEIKEDAVHKGGMNLFGKNFGDFDQAIVLSIKGSAK